MKWFLSKEDPFKSWHLFHQGRETTNLTCRNLCVCVCTHSQMHSTKMNGDAFAQQVIFNLGDTHIHTHTHTHTHRSARGVLPIMLAGWSLRCGQCHSHCCYNRQLFCCGRLYFLFFFNGATERTLTTQEQSCLRLQWRETKTHTHARRDTHKQRGRDVGNGMKSKRWDLHRGKYGQEKR